MLSARETETDVQDLVHPSVASWQAILTLVLFFISNVAVIVPLRLLVPPLLLKNARRALTALHILPERHAHDSPLKTRHIHLNFITVPLASVLILLAAGVFHGRTLRDGIVGANGIQPLNIMALFISLAYISISLDATGLFRFLAFWVASKGGSSGRRLYTYLYVFFLLCGIVVGNDPVVLTGTPFLSYFTSVAGITPPTAWIFAQFTAANMAAVVLVSANLTNLVLSGAFNLSFLSYAAHVVLPFLAAAVCTYPVLLLLFRSRTLVPARIETGLTHAEVHAALIDKRGAIFGSALLVVTLGVLVGVSTIGVPVWEVTVPPAVIMLLRDSYHDWTTRNVGDVDEDATECGEDCICWAKEKNCTADADVASPPTVQVRASNPRAEVLDDDATECGEDCICWAEEKNRTADAGVDVSSQEVDAHRRVDDLTTPDADPAQCGEGCICTTEQNVRNPDAYSGHPSEPKVEAHVEVEPTRNEQELPTIASPSTPDAAAPTSAHVSLSSKASGSQEHLNLVTIVSAALAWSTKSFPTVTHIAARLPVALLPFSFLMFILVQGLLTQGWVEVFAHWWSVWVSKTGTLGAVGGMGFLSCILCNFCGTNIGATILLARVLQLWASSGPVDPRARDGAIYALAIGSNFGAFTLTFSASLAGLLWRQILRQKDIHVRPRDFLLLNLPISFVSMLVACAVLVGQAYVEHRER
ncbi:hypothetical protein C8Q74DRAFT_560085 [Fomes fomentarius]|nr:hypothetical protein C8Q74DRAFT_560085 [Fomes fomentarius]